MDTHENSWNALRAAQVAGWYVGIPLYNLQRQRWQLYAYDTTERTPTGQRRLERTVVAQTEAECVREMARCLRELSEGRLPR
jgi:hypothetical protein